MSIKVESGYIASKIFLQNDPKRFQTNLAPLFRKLGSSEIHEKNPAFYNFAAFTHIWLPQGNYMTNQVHVFKESTKYMRQGALKI